MKGWILKILVKPAGNILTGVVTAFVAWAVSALANLNPDLAAQVDQAAVVSFVWGLLMWAVNGWINAQLTKGPKTLQRAINDQSSRNIAVDGVILPDGATARELERLTGLPVRRALKP